MAIGDQYRQISPFDRWIEDANGNIVGIQNRRGEYSRDIRFLTEDKVAATEALVSGAGKPGAGSRLVRWGDSFAQDSNLSIVPTSAVCAAGVVTVTRAAHGFYNGELIHHMGFDQPLANVQRARITYLTANTYSYPAPGLADGALSTTASLWLAVRASVTTINRPGCHLQRLSKGAFDLSYSMGLAGHNTTQTLARAADVLAMSPNIVAIIEGFNDQTQGIAKEVTYANIVAKIDLLRAAPSVSAILVSSLSPWNSGAGANSATTRQNVLWINKQLEAYCKRFNGVFFIDIYSAAVNPATGLARAGWINATDNVHPTWIWSHTWANLALAALSTANYRRRRLVSSSEDNKAALSTNTNVLANAPWTTSGGTVTVGSGGTATGTAATGVSVTNQAGAPATTASVVTDSEGVGQAQRVSIVPAAAGDQVRISFSMTAADFTPGAMCRPQFKVSTTGTVASNLRGLVMQLVFIDANGTYFAYEGNSNAAAANEIPQTGVDLTDAVIAMDDIAIPAGGVTTARLDLLPSFLAAGTAFVVDVSRASVDVY